MVVHRFKMMLLANGLEGLEVYMVENFHSDVTKFFAMLHRPWPFNAEIILNANEQQYNKWSR